MTPPAAAEWATRSERGSQFWLRVMTWISLRCGRRASRAVLHLITVYFVLFSPTARRASSAYLTKALVRRPHWRDFYRHVLAFSTMIHDRIYLLNDRLDLFDVTVTGREHVDALVERGRGVFLMGAHFGSFEVLRTAAHARFDCPVGLMMFEENARKIHAAMAAINPALEQDIIPLGRIDTMLQVQQRIDDGGIVGVLADRTLGGDAMVSLEFLGGIAQFPLGPMRLAAVMKCPVVFMAGMYLGGNRYHIRFAPLADFSQVAREQRNAAVAAGVRAYRDQLEHCCREAPYNWFNFFDFWQPPMPVSTKPPADKPIVS